MIARSRTFGSRKVERFSKLRHSSKLSEGLSVGDNYFGKNAEGKSVWTNAVGFSFISYSASGFAWFVF